MLLNNDVVVTDGWLDQLVALATAKVTAETGKGRHFTAERTETTEESAEREEDSQAQEELSSTSRRGGKDTLDLRRGRKGFAERRMLHRRASVHLLR